ncbi:hypothetical protein XBFFL1_2360014 [Xenorhabdus bovienii str. feltiae Florida]|uniref:Uncharacterized protein n=1 Tax=Xenorhabdus bovienii str. feltiae Moldova TaxID=1398200 RepID=A0A077NVJ2_XENBV|nr:hypothetical protein XBFFR1_1490014 [Xenorhabdus bovienii str. feltiae France]CDG92841.1 hypothetical protein XBFFL1_2360014 [Xenorhabdus bovienii str. feltiae Florida]CDH02383.1 hypothetical protein XBFM1_2600098 [Xenorhabdus bovienii str. feltiae Moldova]
MYFIGVILLKTNITYLHKNELKSNLTSYRTYSQLSMMSKMITTESIVISNEKIDLLMIEITFCYFLYYF